MNWHIVQSVFRLAVYTINLVQDAVSRLRDLSPLWEMHQDGIDLSTIEWAEH